MDKKVESVMKDVKNGAIKISRGMFFLPDDLKKIKGKWLLYIKKGLLVKLEEKERRKV